MTRINLFHAPSTRNSVAWGKTNYAKTNFAKANVDKKPFHPNHQHPDLRRASDRLFLSRRMLERPTQTRKLHQPVSNRSNSADDNHSHARARTARAASRFQARAQESRSQSSAHRNLCERYHRHIFRLSAQVRSQDRRCRYRTRLLRPPFPWISCSPAESRSQPSHFRTPLIPTQTWLRLSSTSASTELSLPISAANFPFRS